MRRDAGFPSTSQAVALRRGVDVEGKGDDGGNGTTGLQDWRYEPAPALLPRLEPGIGRGLELSVLRGATSLMTSTSRRKSSDARQCHSSSSANTSWNLLLVLSNETTSPGDRCARMRTSSSLGRSYSFIVAVKDGAALVHDRARPGTRIPDGLKDVARIRHPDRRIAADGGHSHGQKQ